jgi:hypothetical protein
MKILKPPSDEETLEAFEKMTSIEILSVSVKCNYFDGIKIAIERGADVNLDLGCGDTPLIFATFHGKFDIVKYLVENGADINSKNKWNETAMSIARDKSINYLNIDNTWLTMCAIHDYLEIKNFGKYGKFL